ncbi:hypothetical protein [Listeria valentina]|uniref:hypothetical protein n=1 Tax=Listeria valentina TaxID=2705293 RepID=UPI001431973C|nr:hypothetical protein [Listeria valentina]
MSNPITDALGEVEKKLDKLLITNFTASNAVSTTKHNEVSSEDEEKEMITSFKKKDKSDMESLNSAIKGKWFNSAEKALKEARNKFKDI